MERRRVTHFWKRRGGLACGRPLPRSPRNLVVTVKATTCLQCLAALRTTRRGGVL